METVSKTSLLRRFSRRKEREGESLSVLSCVVDVALFDVDVAAARTPSVYDIVRIAPLGWNTTTARSGYCAGHAKKSWTSKIASNARRASAGVTPIMPTPIFA